MKAIIGAKDKEIAFSEFVDVPPFLRFDQVSLFYYNINTPPIAEKCELFLGSLPSIKSTLNDSNIIHFACKIDQEDPNAFSNHSTLLEHIRQVVSICDSSRGYSFVFVQLQHSTGMDITVASILDMPSITRSSTVYFTFDDKSTSTVTKLPIETISNWLNRERRAMDQNQRNLVLNCEAQYAQIQEMCEFLKQVSFIFEYFSSTYFFINDTNGSKNKLKILQ